MTAKSDFVTAFGGATTAVGATKAFTAVPGYSATMTSHGLVDFTGPVRIALDGAGTLPGGLAASTDYWLLRIDNDKVQFCSSAANAVAGDIINLTDEGDGTFDVSRAAFQEDFTEAEVDTETNVLTLAAHGIETGFGPVQFSLTGDASALPAGLAASTNYWLIKTGTNTVKVATTLANALAGTAIDITDVGTDGSGGFRCAAGAIADSFADEDVTIGQSLACTAHGKDTGFGPVRLTTSGTLPAGLALSTNYWFVKVDADTFQLATSKANALAGTVVDILDAGSGTHTMRSTAQCLADQLEQVLDEVLTSPGNKDCILDVNVTKFWDEAVQGSGW